MNRADAGQDIVMRHTDIRDGSKKMGSLEDTDNASKAVQKTPNRVSLDHIKSRVKAQYTFTLDKALRNSPVPVDAHLECMTIAVLVMDNDFIIIGKTAPADPANFNAELGRKFALEDALRQAWPLEGYLLRESMVQHSARDAVLGGTAPPRQDNNEPQRDYGKMASSDSDFDKD